MRVGGSGDPAPIRTRRGFLVAFEGIDGAGKTTQARLLAARLQSVGVCVVETKEPTRGPHGQRLRESAATGRLRKEEELQAFLDDRQHHVATLIAPALASGHAVIVDRYYFSTAAYQGARGFDPESIILVNETFAPKPDLLVLLTISVEEGLRRIGTRDGSGGANRFEKRRTLQRCAAIFRQLERPYLLRLDGQADVSTIHERVVASVLSGPLFRATCHKEYLAECEPEYCTYRIQRQCDYPMLGPLRPEPPVSAGELNALVADAGLSPEEKMDRLAAMLRGSPR